MLAIILAVMVAGSVCALAGPSVSSKWGMYLASHATEEKVNEIYAVGKTATIYKSDIEKAAYYYALSGMNNQEASAQAYDFCREKESLFHEAKRRGYSATENEIDSYIDDLRKMMKEASNKAEVYDVINQFGSEEEYWEYLKEVYRKDLPIQKMNMQMETDFFECNKNASDEQWQKYFLEWKRSLVEAEQFILK